MITVVSISLENDMDLVLAHKRSMKVAEKLGLTIATQTTFATAVSEIARTVIEHTDNGMLEIGLEQNKQRYNLVSAVTYDKEIKFNNADAGFYYAQKLVPEFSLEERDDFNLILMKIGLPRSLKLDPIKISVLRKFFEQEQPLNAYEEIKQRNQTLNKLADQQVEELRQSKIIDEKKTEFMSIASHELKTPITIIKAYTQIAKGLNENSVGQIKAILEKVDTQTGKLLSLVQQLLDVSKVENGNLQYNKEELPLNAFVSDMVNILKYTVPNHEVLVNLSDDVIISIDKLRMEQVFSNLLGNAAKYSRPETKICVKGYLDEDHQVTISISDNGIGMSDVSMASIFEKFYRAEDVVKTHSGLGMGLLHYIEDRWLTMGGKIWVESEEGSGSTFFFSIPYLSKIS